MIRSKFKFSIWYFVNIADNCRRLFERCLFTTKNICAAGCSSDSTATVSQRTVDQRRWTECGTRAFSTTCSSRTSTAIAAKQFARRSKTGHRRARVRRNTIIFRATNPSTAPAKASTEPTATNSVQNRWKWRSSGHESGTRLFASTFCITIPARRTYCADNHSNNGWCTTFRTSAEARSKCDLFLFPEGDHFVIFFFIASRPPWLPWAPSTVRTEPNSANAATTARGCFSHTNPNISTWRNFCVKCLNLNSIYQNPFLSPFPGTREKAGRTNSSQVSRREWRRHNHLGLRKWWWLIQRRNHWHRLRHKVCIWSPTERDFDFYCSVFHCLLIEDVMAMLIQMAKKENT